MADKPMKNCSPAAGFRDWLAGRIADLDPGSMLPSGKRLARMHGISESTVQRVLGEYHRRGKLIRIAGRGTFIPGRPGRLPPMRTEVRARRSAESVAEILYEQICDGTFKAGDALPSIKYLTLDWKISRSTAVAAYRSLAGRGCVHKVGRSFYAGSARELAPRRARKDLVFYYGVGDSSLPALFRTHPLSFAYRTLENELLKHNYRIRYRSIDGAAGDFDTWRRGQRFPSGIVVGYTDRSPYDAFEPSLRGLVSRTGRGTPSALVAGKVTDRKIPGVAYMNHGHVNTRVFRELSRYIARQRFHRLVVCHDETRKDNLYSIWSTLKLWVETLHRRPSIDIQYLLRLAGTDDFRTRFGRRVAAEGSRRVLGTLSKYNDTDFANIERHVHVCEEFTEAFAQARSGEVWVFVKDSLAVEAAEFFERSGRSTEDRPAIIGLENDPAFLDRGISACVVDQYALGYLMAHAVIGDIRVPESSKGYVQAPVLMLRRG